MVEQYDFKLKGLKKSWMVNISGHYLSVIKDYLTMDGIARSGVDSIVLNASKVLGYCPDPYTDVHDKKTGIVIGKVQSGKTSNFIALMAMAFDNKYDLILVLGGTKKNLVEQNKERIEKYFEKEETVIVLDTENNMSQINEQTIAKFVKNKRKVIIVSLKGKVKLSKLRQSLFKKDSYFSNKPVLIIDDEGDEYSLNTLVSKGKKSSTYSAIIDVTANLNRHAFLSVTATPQANLIISTIDNLSPDFGVLVYPGEGYCGLETFHEPESKYCIKIPDSEETLLETKGIPKSFLEALSRFFVGAAINTLRESETRKFSMLIHPSRIVQDLKDVYNITERIISKWAILASNQDDMSFDELRNRLSEAVSQYKNEGVEIKKEDLVVSKACDIICYCGVHLITGANQLSDNDKPFDHNIYIGGQMVGRGLTIKGLAITYIIRSAQGISNVDTVQQRARWFGYKESYVDLCRVFTTKKIIDDFEDIKIHEEEMWELIENNNSNGTNFKDMRRIFVLGEQLRMTRTSVGKTVTYRFSLWNIEKSFQSIPEYRKSNIQLVENMRRKYSEVLFEDYFGSETFHVVAKDLSFYRVVKEDLFNYRSAEKSTCSIEFVNKLCVLLFKYIGDVRCDLVWMRNGADSTHSIDNSNRIPNYFVGRRPHNAPEHQITYHGDYKYHRENVITIQIHNIVKKGSPEEISPTLAIYVPDSISAKLKNLVTPA